MSVSPTYGRTSPEAIVETISFGTPTGSRCIAAAASDVPPLPPRARIPSSRPSPWSRVTTSAAPSRIAAIAAPRSPASASALRSAPPAVATSSAETSTAYRVWPIVPASTTSTSQPRPRSRPRTNSYSAPFVSRVPSRMIVGIRSASAGGEAIGRPEDGVPGRLLRRSMEVPSPATLDEDRFEPEALQLVVEELEDVVLAPALGADDVPRLDGMSLLVDFDDAPPADDEPVFVAVVVMPVEAAAGRHPE